MSRPTPPAESAAGRQRLDLWLFHARVVRTRSLAQKLATSGHVRVNGQRVEQAGRGVRPGDVLTIALDRQVRVLRIARLAERRGPAPEAQTLYETLGAGDEAAAPGGVLAPRAQSG
ncbi:MAG: RNA-binding S4 domain-containing protein [Methylobacteriaceae bacterium]|nr:RNA-binding S4 domain-containing protein [Methylobacteriaceae bacterium]